MELLYLDEYDNDPERTSNFKDTTIDTFGTADECANAVAFANPFTYGSALVNENVMSSIEFPQPQGALHKKAPDTADDAGVTGDTVDYSTLEIGKRGVLNPLWQYNDYADPRTAGQSGVNFGRVYNSEIRPNDMIVFMQPGMPKFGAGGFLGGILGNNKFSALQKAIVSESLYKKSEFDIGSLAKEMVDMSNNRSNPMKFYDFQPCWTKYRNYVAGITEELLVRLGLDEYYEEQGYFERDDGKNVDILTRFQSYYSFANKILSSQDTQLSHSSFIPIRVEKSSQMSESYNNEIGESMIKDTIVGNDKMDMAREAMYLTQSKGGESHSISEHLIGGATSIISGAESALSVVSSGAAAILKTGGNLLFPQIWKNSTMSRSISLTIKLHAPLGDLITYYENVLFPLACILAFCWPEQVDSAVYASPPLIRLRSRGWLSCDMGMVESVSIQRSTDKNDWTVHRFPRSIDVTLNIRDMFGTMVMSLMGGEGRKYAGHYNTPLSDYLNCLGGLDTFTCQDFPHKIKNWMKRSGRSWKRLVDPLYWDNAVAGAISKIPGTRFPLEFFAK